jgi:spore maturation protein CgeB
LNEKISNVFKINEELNEKLSAKDKERKEALAGKEAELNEKLSAKDKERKEALAGKEAELNEKLSVKDKERKEALSKEQELFDKSNQLYGQIRTLNEKISNVFKINEELNEKLSAKDKERKEALAGKEAELNEKLSVKDKERKEALKAKERVLRNSLTWRIGRIFVRPPSLIRLFIKRSLQNRKKINESYRKTAIANVSPDSSDILKINQQKSLITNRDNITLGCILDEFTAACFEPECRMLTFRPDNWKEILEREYPQAIFVESAWRGNDGSWQYRVAKYQKNMGDELIDLLNWARCNKIPSIFWNKEDPVHFERFIEKAGYLDYVFTSDSDCIPKYQKRLGHDRISPLPFAAQPTIHNPILLHPRQGSVCFAGTYYCDRHEERRCDMDHILKPAIPFGLEIYDRQYGMVGKQAELFRFPDLYQSSIKGRLDYQEMIKAYKNYQVFLNVNSVKTSPTMFSRRVFELLACGTPVISTYSKGIVDLLGDDIVLISESEEDTRNHLEHLISDGDTWMKASVKGIRKVMEEHTYSDRMKYILDQVGIKSSKKKLISFTILAKVSTIDEINRLAAIIKLQTYRQFDLIALSHRHLPKKSLEKLRNLARDTQITNVVLDSINSSAQCIQASNSEYFAILDMRDYYGSNYLKDFALAAMYSGSDLLGKHSYLSFSQKSEKIKKRSMGYEFRYVNSVPAATLVFRKASFLEETFAKFFQSRVFRSDDNHILSTCRFNYVQGLFDKRADEKLTEALKRNVEV